MGKCSGNMKTCFVLALVASIALGALATTEVEPFDAVSISEDDIGEAGPADHGELARDLHVGLGEAGADPVKAAKAGLKAAIKAAKASVGKAKKKLAAAKGGCESKEGG